MEGYRRPPAGHPFDDATRLESSSALLPEDFYRSIEVSRIRLLWPAGTLRDEQPDCLIAAYAGIYESKVDECGMLLKLGQKEN
jgi:hypothetical protein